MRGSRKSRGVPVLEPRPCRRATETGDLVGQHDLATTVPPACRRRDGRSAICGRHGTRDRALLLGGHRSPGERGPSRGRDEPAQQRSVLESIRRHLRRLERVPLLRLRTTALAIVVLLASCWKPGVAVPGWDVVWSSERLQRHQNGAVGVASTAEPPWAWPTGCRRPAAASRSSRRRHRCSRRPPPHQATAAATKLSPGVLGRGVAQGRADLVDLEPRTTVRSSRSRPRYELLHQRLVNHDAGPWPATRPPYSAASRQWRQRGTVCRRPSTRCSRRSNVRGVDATVKFAHRPEGREAKLGDPGQVPDHRDDGLDGHTELLAPFGISRCTWWPHATCDDRQEISVGAYGPWSQDRPRRGRADGRAPAVAASRGSRRRRDALGIFFWMSTPDGDRPRCRPCRHRHRRSRYPPSGTVQRRSNGALLDLGVKDDHQLILARGSIPIFLRLSCARLIRGRRVARRR